MSLVPIRNLIPFEDNKKIRVRICRLWRPRAYGSNDQFAGLHCVLVDSIGDAIQATIKEIDYDIVGPKIEAGCVYEISHFHTVNNRSSYKIVPHVGMLIFNERTNFKKLTAIHPAIPIHRFHLLDYSQLPSRINVHTLLTDLMGRIIAIQPLEHMMVDNARIENKCEIHIENMRRNEIRVTLWSDAAKDFDHEAVQRLPPPVFVVFTSLKVKEYQKKPVLSSTNATAIFLNPEIPEIDSYKLAFRGFAMPINILPPSTAPRLPPQQLETADRLTVKALNHLDPQLCKDKILTCRATITRFDTHAGWWYKACPSCFKQLRITAQNDKLICPKHNAINPIPWFKVSFVIADQTDVANVIVIGKQAEQLFRVSCYNLVVESGFIDQNQFPEALLRVRGKPKIFQLRFGTLKSDLNRNDLLIHAVFDEEPLLIESSSTPPAEQVPIPKENPLLEKLLLHSPSPSAKIAPVTPTPSSSTNLRKKTISKANLTVRRALFSAIKKQRKKYQSVSETEEKAEQSDAPNPPEQSDSTFDDIPLKELKTKPAAKKAKISRTEEHSPVGDNKEDEQPPNVEQKSPQTHTSTSPDP